jgi:hypothetical protein
MTKSELIEVSENVRVAIEYVRKALEELEILESVYELAEKDDPQALKIERELTRNPAVARLSESESRLRGFLKFLYDLERRVK